MLYSLQLPTSSLGLALCSLLLATTAQAAPADHVLAPRAPKALPTKYPVVAYAPLGDSYASGPGDGGKLVTGNEGICSIFDTSYPFLVDNDKRLRFPDPPTRALYLGMCAAATTLTIPSQVSVIGPESNLVSISVGSNDIGLAGVLNDCVYGFYPSGRSCSDALAAAQAVISSRKFIADLTAAYNSIFVQAEGANVYVMGYPTFFNEDTSQCNTTCFQPLHACEDKFLLSFATRNSVNAIVVNLNMAAKAVVESLEGSVSGSIQFVSSVDHFHGHRFCENGVKEPDYNNPRLWFFPFTYFPRPWLMQFHSGNCDDYDLLAVGELGDLLACAVFIRRNQARLNRDTTFQSTQFADPGTNSGVQHAPDYLNRVFHPTVGGAMAIHASLIRRYLNA